MKFVAIRKMDSVGRIVIPADIRRFYKMDKSASMKISMEGGEIIISHKEASSGAAGADSLGRIVIPSGIRKSLGISAGDFLAVLPCEDGIHLYRFAE